MNTFLPPYTTLCVVAGLLIVSGRSFLSGVTLVSWTFPLDFFCSDLGGLVVVRWHFFSALCSWHAYGSRLQRELKFSMLQQHLVQMVNKMEKRVKKMVERCDAAGVFRLLEDSLQRSAIDHATSTFYNFLNKGGQFAWVYKSLII